MLRRLLPTLLVFGTGFLALVWGLATLQSIFARERDQARAGVGAQRDALRQYARQALREDLGRELAGARPVLKKALADPLLDADRLLLIDQQEQLLPRLVRYRKGTGTVANKLYMQLRDPSVFPSAPEPDSPWAQRLKLRRRFMNAVVAGDTAEVEATFRDLLTHRASFVITSTRDLPYMLALLDFFGASSKPDPALMRRLLRDGFALGRGQRMQSLQHSLLAQRSRFTAPEFAFLRTRLLALCQAHGVTHDDFRARATAPVRAPLRVPPGLSDSALILGGQYFVQADGPLLRGVRVDLPRMLMRITVRMRHLRLLTRSERITAPAPAPDPGAQPVTAFTLRVESPRWKRLQRDISRRYRLKTLLTVASGLLALVIVILAVIFQHRKHRFLELKSDFVASVSHELRTPLASIRLLAETLERRTAGQENVREYPRRIVRDVDGLTFLVENILSFNRLDKGRWIIKPHTVRLDELVEDLTQDLEAATAAEVQVRTESVDGVTLQGDAELVRLLLGNLGRNGCLYNNRDPVVLTFSATRRGDRLRVSVSDNGVGIPTVERDKVFGEFYRPTDPTGRGVRGSGLGLAMCRRIMKLHGGTIRIAETGPDGTTFELDFPGRK